MDNLAEALQYSASQQSIIEDRRLLNIGDRQFCFDNSGKLNPVVEATPSAVRVRTLTGIVDYLIANPDGLVLGDMFLHVVGYGEVKLCSPLFGPFEQRSTYIVAEASQGGSERRSPLDTYIDAEDAILWISANVVPDDERDDLLRALAAIQIDAGAVLSDDGVSQTVAMKTGARLVDKATLKARIVIRPYSTFSEIEQPAREFVLRLDKSGRVGLFSADGDRWKATAMQSIKEWLAAKALPCKLIA